MGIETYFLLFIVLECLKPCQIRVLFAGINTNPESLFQKEEFIIMGKTDFFLSISSNFVLR